MRPAYTLLKAKRFAEAIVAFFLIANTDQDSDNHAHALSHLAGAYRDAGRLTESFDAANQSRELAIAYSDQGAEAHASLQLAMATLDIFVET